MTETLQTSVLAVAVASAYAFVILAFVAAAYPKMVRYFIVSMWCVLASAILVAAIEIAR